MEVEFGDAILEIPDGLDQKQIKAVLDGFRQTPEFSNMIDTETGAEYGVRTVVGGALTPKDRLASIRNAYPDAQPHGDDNFVFTHPETGRFTLYNPEGFDAGDVFSVGREAAMMAGGTVGAAASGVPTLGLGSAVGAGLGAAAGGQMFDLASQFLAGGVNTQGGLERSANAFIDFGATATGQKLGELAGKGLKAAAGGLTSKAQKITAAFRSLGIEPPAGAATGSRSLATVESMLESTPSSGDILQTNAEKVLGQVAKAAGSLSKKFGKPKTVEGAGDVIKQASARAAERFGAKQSEAYEKAFSLIGDKSPVRVDSLRALKQELQASLARAPQSLSRSLQPALARINQIEKDAAEGAGIEFGALREIRTMLGKELDAPVLVGSTSAKNAALKRVYGALTEDMSAAAQSTSAKAAKLLKGADKRTRLFMDDQAELLSKIEKFDTDGRAYRFLMTSAKDGGKTLAKLRGQFTPEEWDDVTASVLGQMGKANAGAQDAAGDVFSVSTFLTNWNKIAPEAKKALFSGNRYKGLQKELDTLVTAASSLKGLQSVANTSNTARSMISYTMLQTLVGGMVGTAAGGDTQSGLMGAGAAILAPRMAAKLITSPRFVKWLTTPITSPNAVGPHIGRLAAIAKADPELRDEITAYISALKGEN